MKKTRNEIAVGAFVIIGFILLSLFVFFISGVYFFRSGYVLNVMYDYVDILDKGAPVRMAGVRIGEVNKVELIYDEKSQHLRVRVKLFIEKGGEIRENYLFEIRGTHILSEPHIEITPVAGKEPLVKDGELIEGVHLVPLEDLIKRSHNIAKNLDEMIKEFHDAFVDPKTSGSMKKLVANMSKLSDALEKVLNENSAEDLQKTVHNIRASSEAVNDILTKMQKGEGTAGKLLVSDELYQEIKGFVAEIKAHPWRLLKSDKKKFFF